MKSDLSFTVYFDGTGNSLRNDKGLVHTNVAKLYQSHSAKGTDLSYNNEERNKYNPQRDKRNLSSQSEKVYFDGVGSQKKGIVKAYEGATGAGGSQRIEDAYNAIVDFHNKYPEKNVNINIVGFSRGAAQSRALSNKVIKEGIPELDKNGGHTGKNLIEPGKTKINKLAIFDTVASYGLPLSDRHAGKDLKIHDNVQSTTHLIAANEYRKSFKLTSVQGKFENNKVEEIAFPGAHSQIGGGYKNDILSAGPLSIMHKRLMDSGLKMNELTKEDQKKAQKYNELITDPKKVKEELIDSRIIKEEGKKDKTFPMEKGWVDRWNKQKYEFEHNVKGRKVIYEVDKSLENNGLKHVKNKVKSKYLVIKDNILKLGKLFLKQEKYQEEPSFDKFESAILRASKNNTHNRSDLAKNLKRSKPTSHYIKSINPPPTSTEKEKNNKQTATSKVNISDSKKIQQANKSEEIKNRVNELRKSYMELPKSDAIKKHPELEPLYNIEKSASKFANSTENKRKFNEVDKKKFVDNVREKSLNTLGKGKKLPDIKPQKKISNDRSSNTDIER